jgi:hypothetical protein
MFIEMRSVEEAFLMMELDGIKYRDQPLRIKRPSEYEKNPPVSLK